MARPLAHPFGVRSTFRPCSRWCRFAQPPANRFEPSGFRWGSRTSAPLREYPSIRAARYSGQACGSVRSSAPPVRDTGTGHTSACRPVLSSAQRVSKDWQMLGLGHCTARKIFSRGGLTPSPSRIKWSMGTKDQMIDHKPPRTPRTRPLRILSLMPALPSKKPTTHTRFGRPAKVVEDQ